MTENKRLVINEVVGYNGLPESIDFHELAFGYDTVRRFVGGHYNVQR